MWMPSKLELILAIQHKVVRGFPFIVNNELITANKKKYNSLMQVAMNLPDRYNIFRV